VRTAVERLAAAIDAAPGDDPFTVLARLVAESAAAP
jgi:hypothetical protein